MYNKLFIFVEGPDDYRFFENVIKQLFTPYFKEVIIKEYAERTQSFVNTIVSTCKGRNKCYIFHSDIDDNKKDPTWKKEKVLEKYSEVEEAKIVIVITEIESWYLAGLDEESSKKLGIHYLDKTDKISKEDFWNLKPKKFDSRIDLMSEILKEFEISTAKKKNQSLNLFLTDFIPGFIKINCI
jgi:hypothetical protein